MKKNIFILFAIVVILFSGCSQKIPELGSVSPTASVLDSGYGKEQGSRIYDDSVVSNDGDINQMDSMSSEVLNGSYGSKDELISAVENEVLPIYFATDSYKIAGSEREKVSHDATIFNGELARDLNIKIEGNCDEWGTDEYNYALGLKRAKSVKNILVNSGIDEDRMSLTSYGESTPICSEHNAACWQQNRRVDFKLFP